MGALVFSAVLAVAPVMAAQDKPLVDEANERYNEVLGARPADHPGAPVYAENCASCHQGGDRRAPHEDMLRLMSPASIVAALTDGAMKLQGEPLSGTEKVAVAEYLAGVPLGAAKAAAAPPQCSADRAAFDFADLPAWPGWGITRGNTRHVTGDQAGIGKADLPKLKLKWAFAFPNALRVRSQPMPAGGALYMGSHNGNVYALDRETGCVRWTFPAAAEVRTGIVVSPWDKGDSTARPALYFGDLVGNVYAVDAQSGQLLWKERADDHPNVTITAAPVLYEGKLYVSVSSLEVISAGNPDYACCTFRGSVIRFDAATGEREWQVHTVDEPAPHGVNPRGVPNLAPSGAPVWNSVAIDEERRQIYFGTGENYSSPASATSDAIFALDMDSGAMRWVYQATEGDAWNAACQTIEKINCPAEDGPDMDFGAGAVYVADAGNKGLVIAGQKSGVVHALDPDTGRLLWQRKLGRGGLNGGIHFGLSVGDGRIYAPIADNPDGRSYPDDPRPGLYALDFDGKLLWETPMADRCDGRKFCAPGNSAAIVSTPELVFAVGLDGWLRAYDAASGQVLWRYDTTQEVTALSGEKAHGGSLSGGAAPIPYNGMLFVSSGYGFSGFMPGNLLLAFGTGD